LEKEGDEDIADDKILLGTSGWSYEEWIGPFYVKREKKLKEYSRLFRTAEINSTFYRYPTPGMIYGLIKASPSNFVFSAKLPKTITHTKKLDPDAGVEEDIKTFLKLMSPLGRAGKLGAVLIQLPPRFSYSKIETFSRFLTLLPEDFNFAVEFRNESWLKDDTWSLLREHNVAYTIVDEPLLPPSTVFTADFSYIRWHGRGQRPWFNYRYSEEELREWVPKVKESAEKTERVYGYFNNHFHGYAPENCIQLYEMMGKATRLQRKVRKRIQEYIAGKQATLPVDKLPTSQREAMKLSISQLLREFTDKGRISRAETIRSSSISFKKQTASLIKATVKDYRIEIDLNKKTVRHDCEDWKKIVAEKKLCKHVVRVFLSLPQERSKSIMAKMLIEKDLWNFETL
jgi:uncharacterized protein YecE (DUF72 family)